MKSIKKLSFIKRLALIYLLICFVLLGLSFLGLVWGDWEIIFCFGIGTIFGLLNIVLMVKGIDVLSPDAKSSKMWIVYISYLTRFILVAAGLTISTVVIWKTMPDPAVKLRYLNLLGTGIPYFISALATILVNPEEEKGKQKDFDSSKDNTKGTPSV